MKVLVIGQSPSRRGNPDTPLVGKDGSSRLATIADLPVADFTKKVEAVNIFTEHQGRKPGRGDAFDIAAATERAQAIDLTKRHVIFLGRAVARAFGHKNAKFFEPLPNERAASAWCMPHPSGLNRFWNKKDNVAKAREFLRARLGLA